MINNSPLSTIQVAQKELVVEAINFIENNLQEPISLPQITRQFEKSHWHFQRLFRCITGISLGTYLRMRRLTEASFLLRNSSQKIIDIAMQFDFGSQASFTRAFKEFSQMTPLEYRRSTKYLARDILRPLSREKIDFYWRDVQRTPTIAELPSKNFYGLRVDFKSHFEEGSDCSEKVVAHWEKFLPRKKEIRHQIGKELYGLALSTELELRERKLSYLACVETSDLEQKIPDFEYVQISGGSYAAFENRGLAQQRSSLLDFIYGIWLPSSNYERGRDYDFEVFDRRYSLGNLDSISTLYIPLKSKSKMAQNG
jgi:AraC family transcriptional regulator